MSRKPSRILNDDNLFFGLDRHDIIGLGICFYFFQVLFVPLKIEFLALISTGVVAIILSTIRLKYRRKIIRDLILCQYYKIMKGGVYNDPGLD